MSEEDCHHPMQCPICDDYDCIKLFQKCRECKEEVCLKCFRWDPFPLSFCIECYSKNKPNLKRVIELEHKRISDGKHVAEHVPFFDDRRSVVRISWTDINEIRKIGRDGDPQFEDVKLEGNYEDVIQSLRDHEMNELFELDLSKASDSPICHYMMYVEPYDRELKKFIDDLEDDGFHYALLDCYGNDGVEYRSLHLYISDSDLKLSTNELVKGPYRLIYTNSMF